jgi:hypothetical protein
MEQFYSILNMNKTTFVDINVNLFVRYLANRELWSTLKENIIAPGKVESLFYICNFLLLGN